MSNKKYPKIGALLGWSEEPTSEDGLFLQPDEATSIEASLVSEEEYAAVTQSLNEATAEVGALTASVEALTTAATAAAERESALNTTITGLQEDVARLGGESSGKKGSNLSVVTDDTAETKSALPKYNDPEHPANQAASRYPGVKKN